jgi:hypothetical protein
VRCSQFAQVTAVRDTVETRLRDDLRTRPFRYCIRPRELAETIVERYGGNVDEGRRHELKLEITHSMNWHANRVTENDSIEVRVRVDLSRATSEDRAYSHKEAAA